MVNPEDVLKYITSNDIRWVDVHFVDVPGNLHRISLSGRKVSEESFIKGIKNPDLTNIFCEEEPKELLLVLDSGGFARVPWENSSVRTFSNIYQGTKGERYLKDPRYVADHMETNLKAAGITSAMISSEVEFYYFDNVTIDKSETGQSSSYFVETRESYYGPSPFWNRKNGAYINQPFDSYSGARSQVAETLEDNFNYPVNYHCHGRGAAAQQRIDVEMQMLRSACDALTSLKYIARNVGYLANLMATFMPFPVAVEKGNSLGIGMSLWKKDSNLFYDSKDKYSQMSQTARYFIGGILEHAHSLMVFTNPAVNSYKKLKVDKYYAAWSKYDNGAMVKIPYKRENDDAGKKVILSSSDSSVNPYLAYPAVISAGLDGIKNKKDPGSPVDGRIEGMAKKPKHLPTSLSEAIDALQSDANYLKGVIPSDLLADYIDMKLEEIKEYEEGNTSYEMNKYFNL
ncbi:hypothetical protein JXB01_01245 [Candidatus Micrarchaeota archaeon]|nr:hypothetical protein [Candidatus Micrarchaeota archaeon]